MKNFISTPRKYGTAVIVAWWFIRELKIKTQIIWHYLLLWHCDMIQLNINTQIIWHYLLLWHCDMIQLNINTQIIWHYLLLWHCDMIQLNINTQIICHYLLLWRGGYETAMLANIKRQWRGRVVWSAHFQGSSCLHPCSTAWTPHVPIDHLWYTSRHLLYKGVVHTPRTSNFLEVKLTCLVSRMI